MSDSRIRHSVCQAEGDIAPCCRTRNGRGHNSNAIWSTVYKSVPRFLRDVLRPLRLSPPPAHRAFEIRGKGTPHPSITPGFLTPADVWILYGYYHPRESQALTQTAPGTARPVGLPAAAIRSRCFPQMKFCLSAFLPWIAIMCLSERPCPPFIFVWLFFWTFLHVFWEQGLSTGSSFCSRHII